MNILRIYPKNSKILLVGPYPPPLGGVSVHVKRLIKFLDENSYKVDVFNTSKNYKHKIINSINLFRKLAANHYDIVHIQGYFRAYILVVLFGKYFKNYNLYYTEHNPRIFDNKNIITCYFIKRFLEKLGYLIVVADHIIGKYKENNVKLPDNIHVQNAFLPPPIEEENEIIQSYSSETIKFLSSQKPLIIASAWKIRFHNKTDLYGLDLCVEVTSRLKKNFPEIGFLFALANNHVNAGYIQKIKTRILDLNLGNNFHFMSGQKELWPLFQRADLSVRPTTTDGDAISVREALYFNCPVIASDIVHRPKGTVTFKTGDIDDFFFKANKILWNKQKSAHNPTGALVIKL